MVGTAGQAKGTLQRRIDAQGRAGVGNSFGTRQQRDEDHLQLLAGRELADLLVQMDVLLQRGEEADLAQIVAEDTEARMATLKCGALDA